MGNWPEGVLQSCETNRTDHDKRGRRSWSLGHGRGSGVGQCNRSLTCCVRDITHVHTIQYSYSAIQYREKVRRSRACRMLQRYKVHEIRNRAGQGKGSSQQNPHERSFSIYLFCCCEQRRAIIIIIITPHCCRRSMNHPAPRRRV